MANDCWNSLMIRGDVDTLKLIESRFKSVENSFFSMSNYHLLFDSDVSDFAEEDFGSKRFSVNLEMLDDGLHIYGDSAWSPMIGLFERISNEYGVECTLEYHEVGFNFAGKIVWDSKGVEISNEEWTYWERLCEKSKSDFWEELSWKFEDYDTVSELLEDIDFVNWKNKSLFSMEELEKQFDIYLDND